MVASSSQQPSSNAVGSCSSTTNNSVSSSSALAHHASNHVAATTAASSNATGNTAPVVGGLNVAPDHKNDQGSNAATNAGSHQQQGNGTLNSSGSYGGNSSQQEQQQGHFQQQKPQLAASGISRGIVHPFQQQQQQQQQVHHPVARHSPVNVTTASSSALSQGAPSSVQSLAAAHRLATSNSHHPSTTANSGPPHPSQQLQPQQNHQQQLYAQAQAQVQVQRAQATGHSNVAAPAGGVGVPNHHRHYAIPPSSSSTATAPPHNASVSAAPSSSRSWSVPNPLSAIPPPSASAAGNGVTARAPNPLASLSTNASSNQSRAALAAARAHQQTIAASQQQQRALQQQKVQQQHHQHRPQQQHVSAPQQPLSHHPQQQRAQQHSQGHAQQRLAVPHPLAQQQAQVQARALQQQQVHQRAQQHVAPATSATQQQQQQPRAPPTHPQTQQLRDVQQQHSQPRPQQPQGQHQYAQQHSHQQQTVQSHHHRPQQSHQQPQQHPPQPHPQAQPQQHGQRQAQQQQQQPPPQAQRRPQKVILSPEAKQALAKAIWSALKSPDGKPTEELVRGAEACGLPRAVILNAAKVARERDAAKRKAAAAAGGQPTPGQPSVHAVKSQPQAPTQAVQSQSQPSARPPNHTAYPQQQPAHHPPQPHYAATTHPHAHPVHPTSSAAPANSHYHHPPPHEARSAGTAHTGPPVGAPKQQQQQPPQRQQQQQQQPRQQQQPQPAKPVSKPAPVASSGRQPSRQTSKTSSSTAATTTTSSSSTKASTPAPAPAPPPENPWKRVQAGVFIVQKGRFLALPNTLSGYTSRTSDCKTLMAIHKKTPLPVKKTLADRVSPSTLSVARLVRERLQSHQLKSLSREKLFDPRKFRRSKVEPKKHAKALDRAARKVRQSTADALIKSHKEWSKTLLSHQSDFFKFHKNRKAESQKIAKACRDALDKESKQREKEAAAAERARLAALKSNDMSAYSKLLEETKNDRLKFLMDKTEESFTQISTLLHERGGGHGNTAAGSNEKKKESSSYYESAHFKSEEVRQPSILVGGDLKEYQLAGLQWLVSLYNNKLNGILADEMGLGKTIQAISLIGYLMEFKHNLGPYLVIVPLSTLSNWQNEFIKWCPSARLICYKGTPGVRKDIYKEQVSKGHFNVLLTTYEYIIKDKKFLRKIDWTYAIVDEGHRMKNAQSKFAVTLGTHYNTEYRVLLTGTPLMNQLSELWSLLNFLLPSIFNSVETFDQWFSRPFSQFGSSSAAANSDKESEADQLLSNEERMLIIHRLHELLRPFMLRRVKSEVLDQLPEKVEKVLRCELSSWQKELYKQISVKAVQSNNFLTDSFVEQSTTPSRGLNNVVMQLRKVCNHPMLFSPEGYQINETIVRSSGKVALLDQMLPKLKAAGHRVLIFTQMTAVMTILEDYFSLRGYLSLRLDGSTPAEEREKRMYKFNAPDSPYFIFLLSTRAGGLGLNLTAADTVVIFDSDWNPMMDLQAQDRAHRIGQRSDVSVFRLVTNSPVEEKILSRASEKLNTAALVVEAGKFNKGSVENDNSLERKQLMEILLTDFDTSTAQAAAASKVQSAGQSEKSGSDFGDEDDNNSAASDKEDLNELLSNNENDYQMYAAHDEKRIRDGIPLAELYTSPDDVPDWIKYPGGKNKHKNQNGSLLDDTGDGSRKRKAVTYDDGLTEKQFIRLMEKQAIEDEKQQSVRKKARRGGKFSSTGGDGEDEELADGDAGAELTDWTFRKLINCTKNVITLKDPATKRRLAELFLEKPAPQQFPDYYELIEKPIAINDILRKCRGKLYTYYKEYRDDWRLMVANAIKFNGEDSWVVQDALALEKELDRVMKRNGFSEESLPSPKPPKKPKKLRIKLSLKTVKQPGEGDGEGGGAVSSAAETEPPPKKKRGRKPKAKKTP